MNTALLMCMILVLICDIIVSGQTQNVNDTAVTPDHHHIPSSISKSGPSPDGTTGSTLIISSNQHRHQQVPPDGQSFTDQTDVKDAISEGRPPQSTGMEAVDGNFQHSRQDLGLHSKDSTHKPQTVNRGSTSQSSEHHDNFSPRQQNTPVHHYRHSGTEQQIATDYPWMREEDWQTKNSRTKPRTHEKNSRDEQKDKGTDQKLSKEFTSSDVTSARPTTAVLVTFPPAAEEITRTQKAAHTNRTQGNNMSSDFEPPDASADKYSDTKEPTNVDQTVPSAYGNRPHSLEYDIASSNSHFPLHQSSDTTHHVSRGYRSQQSVETKIPKINEFTFDNVGFEWDQKPPSEDSQTQNRHQYDFRIEPQTNQLSTRAEKQPTPIESAPDYGQFTLFDGAYLQSRHQPLTAPETRPTAFGQIPPDIDDQNFYNSPSLTPPNNQPTPLEQAPDNGRFSLFEYYFQDGNPFTSNSDTRNEGQPPQAGGPSQQINNRLESSTEQPVENFPFSERLVSTFDSSSTIGQGISSQIIPLSIASGTYSDMFPFQQHDVSDTGSGPEGNGLFPPATFSQGSSDQRHVWRRDPTTEREGLFVDQQQDFNTNGEVGESHPGNSPTWLDDRQDIEHVVPFGRMNPDSKRPELFTFGESPPLVGNPLRNVQLTPIRINTDVFLKELLPLQGQDMNTTLKPKAGQNTERSTDRYIQPGLSENDPLSQRQVWYERTEPSDRSLAPFRITRTELADLFPFKEGSDTPVDNLSSGSSLFGSNIVPSDTNKYVYNELFPLNNPVGLTYYLSNGLQSQNTRGHSRTSGASISGNTDTRGSPPRQSNRATDRGYSQTRPYPIGNSQIKSNPVYNRQTQAHVRATSSTRPYPNSYSQTRQSSMENSQTRPNPTANSQTRSNPPRNYQTRPYPISNRQMNPNLISNSQTRTNPIFQSTDYSEWRQGDQFSSPSNNNELLDDIGQLPLSFRIHDLLPPHAQGSPYPNRHNPPPTTQLWYEQPSKFPQRSLNSYSYQTQVRNPQYPLPRGGVPVNGQYRGQPAQRLNSVYTSGWPYSHLIYGHTSSPPPKLPYRGSVPPSSVYQHDHSINQALRPTWSQQQQSPGNSWNYIPAGPHYGSNTRQVYLDNGRLNRPGQNLNSRVFTPPQLTANYNSQRVTMQSTQQQPLVQFSERNLNSLTQHELLDPVHSSSTREHSLPNHSNTQNLRIEIDSNDPLTHSSKSQQEKQSSRNAVKLDRQTSLLSPERHTLNQKPTPFSALHQPEQGIGTITSISPSLDLPTSLSSVSNSQLWKHQETGEFVMQNHMDEKEPHLDLPLHSSLSLFPDFARVTKSHNTVLRKDLTSSSVNKKVHHPKAPFSSERATKTLLPKNNENAVIIDQHNGSAKNSNNKDDENIKSNPGESMRVMTVHPSDTWHAEMPAVVNWKKPRNMKSPASSTFLSQTTLYPLHLLPLATTVEAPRQSQSATLAQSTKRPPSSGRIFTTGDQLVNFRALQFFHPMQVSTRAALQEPQETNFRSAFSVVAAGESSITSKGDFPINEKLLSIVPKTAYADDESHTDQGQGDSLNTERGQTNDFDINIHQAQGSIPLQMAKPTQHQEPSERVSNPVLMHHRRKRYVPPAATSGQHTTSTTTMNDQSVLKVRPWNYNPSTYKQLSIPNINNNMRTVQTTSSYNSPYQELKPSSEAPNHDIYGSFYPYRSTPNQSAQTITTGRSPYQGSTIPTSSSYPTAQSQVFQPHNNIFPFTQGRTQVNPFGQGQVPVNPFGEGYLTPQGFYDPNTKGYFEDFIYNTTNARNYNVTNSESQNYVQGPTIVLDQEDKTVLNRNDNNNNLNSRNSYLPIPNNNQINTTNRLYTNVYNRNMVDQYHSNSNNMPRSLYSGQSYTSPYTSKSRGYYTPNTMSNIPGSVVSENYSISPTSTNNNMLYPTTNQNLPYTGANHAQTIGINQGTGTLDESISHDFNNPFASNGNPSLSNPFMVAYLGYSIPYAAIMQGYSMPYSWTYQYQDHNDPSFSTNQGTVWPYMPQDSLSPSMTPIMYPSTMTDQTVTTDRSDLQDGYAQTGWTNPYINSPQIPQTMRHYQKYPMSPPMGMNNRRHPLVGQQKNKNLDEDEEAVLHYVFANKKFNSMNDGMYNMDLSNTKLGKKFGKISSKRRRPASGHHDMDLDAIEHYLYTNQKFKEDQDQTSGLLGGLFSF